MYVHIGLHKQVRADQRAAQIRSMHNYAESMQGQPGLQQVFTLGDTDDEGVLMGLAIWDSEEAWQVARPAVLAKMAELSAGDTDEVNDHPIEVYHFTEA